MNDNTTTEGRRDFLLLATGTTAVVGTALALWPFIDNMNPAKDTQALSTTEVDLSPIKLGQRITVVWRGKPVFIDHRTPAQIERAVADDDVDMVDMQKDSERVQKAEWLIVVGICTHLGCIPRGQKQSDPVGEFGGWFCPCHGSHYDTSGRIRKGPAPRNLDIPLYTFLDDERVRVG
ncbi:ubiquinol-cytochrome c reductase iron-sulfur subunit [Magnetovibrio sp. PR-2]|uniref:ubiquinol-cytochrome c reductase iron-sulfur subunit n=1 Tax=Magnetovibrio sp. PR-2 TaxID=3120356 RepID=UPI002FCE4EDA